VCSLLPKAAIDVLGVDEEDEGGALYDLWFANHAATSVTDHVDMPIGARDYHLLRHSTPVVAAVLHAFPDYPQSVQVGVWKLLVRLAERAAAAYTHSQE
jgi:hypothetical protein